MIPVVGVPYLNRPDIFEEMMNSIDVEIGTVVVIDNSPAMDLRNYANKSLNVRVVSTGHNIGVSASWNLIFKLTPNVPWWMVINSDVVFYPQSLTQAESLVTNENGVHSFGGFAVFSISPDVIDTVGWFDESFVPAYFEDNDYRYRCFLAGVPWYDHEPVHVHKGSSVIRSDSRYQENNNRTFPMNSEYYQSKWGGPVTKETYRSPFNSNFDVRYWNLSMSRLSDMTWR